MSRASGSQLDRVVQCASSAVLPGAFATVGDPAHRGSDIHAFIYAARKHGRDHALREAPAKLRDFCAAIDLDELRLYITRSAIGEGAFIYNALTNETRALGENIGRRYGDLAVGEFPFSTDFYDEQDHEMVVLDVKTGRLETPHPRDGWQYRLAGVALARHAGLDRARLVRAVLDESAAWKFDEYDAMAIDLDTWAEELRGASGRIEAARAAVAKGHTPDVYPSDEACRWCPCIKSCPSSTGLVRHLPTTLETLSETMRSMTEEQLGAGWPVYQRMKKLVEAIGEEYEAIAREVSLPLPNGKLLVMGETRREYLNVDVANKVLDENYGVDIAVRAMRSTISKESLKAAVGRDQFERALMLIRDAGGVDVKVSTSLREEKIK